MRHVKGRNCVFQMDNKPQRPHNETIDQTRMRNIEENHNRLMHGQEQLAQSMMTMMARMMN